MACSASETHSPSLPTPPARALVCPPSQVASLEDTDGVPLGSGVSAEGSGVEGARGLGSDAVLRSAAAAGGGGARAKAEQVLGQRMERVATAWLEAIDQVQCWRLGERERKRASAVFCEGVGLSFVGVGLFVAWSSRSDRFFFDFSCSVSPLSV